MFKFIHTSDWHAGRVWKGVTRLDELGAVLEHLADHAEKHAVDALLMTGDVFDSGAPPAEAERLVFSFFRRLGQAGISSVVIAGNHDHPARLEAWGLLAQLAQVHTVGRPRPARDGGIITLHNRHGDAARVAAIPFAPARALVTAADLAEDPTDARFQYAHHFRALVSALSSEFREDTVNVLMAHTHLEGASLSHSERAVHLGREWAAEVAAIPARAHYVALGHIHKPQRMEAAAAPTLYAGSPLQLDFGEVGEEKSFVVVEASPAGLHVLERVPYQGGKPLLEVRASLEMLEQDATRLRQAGWLKVTVPLERPLADLNGRVRRLLPNAVAVEVELPASLPVPRAVSTVGMTPAQVYGEYVRLSRGKEVDESLVKAFLALQQSVTE